MLFFHVFRHRKGAFSGGTGIGFFLVAFGVKGVLHHMKLQALPSAGIGFASARLGRIMLAKW